MNTHLLTTPIYTEAADHQKMMHHNSRYQHRQSIQQRMIITPNKQKKTINEMKKILINISKIP